MSYFKWKPNKAQKAAFASKMREVDEFCAAHDIRQSSGSDSYYFTLNDQSYRVSNHSVEASNSGAFDPVTLEQRRELYHPGGRLEDVRYIHAGKTRIIDIYTDLAAGYELDGRGNRKEAR